MNIYYQIFKNRSLLIQKLSGEWSMEKYEKYVREVMKDPELEYVTKILSDFRELNLSIKVINELDELIKIRKEVIEQKFMNVQIVNSPSLTAITHLYAARLSKEGYSYNYCSTLKKALELLNLEETEEEIEELTQNIIKRD